MQQSTIHNEVEELIKVLAQLLSYPSVTPDSAGALEYIAKWLEPVASETLWLKRGVVNNLLICIGDKNAPIFAFAGHVDVVPAGEFKQWSNQQPFILHQDGDVLTARGIADMKGAIVAFLFALKDFLAKKLNYNYQIMLLLTADEEGLAIDGTQVLVEYLQQQNLRLKYCLIGEPSSVENVGDNLKIGRRGSLTGELKIYGKQGHIAYPHLCRNPIHLFAPVLAELTSYVWDQGTEFFPATSWQMANLNAGVGATNVIPAILSANFNFRYNNLHSVESLKRTVSELLQKHDLDYELTWQVPSAVFLAKSANLVNCVKEVIWQQCGYLVKLNTDGGTSDGRFLIKISDELIELGLCNKSIHQVNESSKLSDLIKLRQIYAQILEQLLRD